MIGVDHSVGRWFPILDRHVQGVDYKVCVLVIIDGLANNLSAKGIKDGAAVEFALPGGMFA